MYTITGGFLNGLLQPATIPPGVSKAPWVNLKFWERRELLSYVYFPGNQYKGGTTIIKKNLDKE